MIDFDNGEVFKLKPDDDYAEKVQGLLLDDEEVLGAYKSMRDGIVFTNKRLIAVNVQGITGRKKAFTSLPYRTIVAFAVETAGTLDLDCELELSYSSLGNVKFEFKGAVPIDAIAKSIAIHSLH
ncbi:conserved hypothetical protein [Luminiphilus syltensis NOR5-1B]|uniref:Bacterial Pleckstrin homology domain-containing protein n=1 Tax=Luminiphilus syltensis NOR5-1B TaxID=565045 RepID=B8KTS4_9GAMM|nr:PH domain-containing protein [Luminiphilus syltensis]EED35949.1 conserved hypothetical protein [Luminiphilus syltensis NOR5-1B]